jgi:hypothetical protein
VISFHSRDIGIGCLRSCNHYKDDGWVMYSIIEKKDTPSVLMNLIKVSVCGSGS